MQPHTAPYLLRMLVRAYTWVALRCCGGTEKRKQNINETYLDDISIAQNHKLKISGILGDPINIKLTTPEDLTFAEKVSKIWM